MFSDLDLIGIANLTLVQQLLRYLLVTTMVYLLTTWAFKAYFARRKIRERSPAGKQIRRELLMSLRTVFILSLIGVAIILASQRGLTQIYSDVGQFGWLYLIGSFVVLVVAHDAYFYWTHRFMHHPKLFKAFHKEHHKSSNPTPFTAYSFDVSEALVNGSFALIALTLIPLHPIVILAFFWHQIVRNALGHSGFEVMPARKNGRPLIGFMTTVTHHDLHHGDARYNHGLYFTWWDRWMGTEHPEYLARFAKAVEGTKKLSTTTNPVLQDQSS